MTDILTSISRYDEVQHTPYPKLEYILKKTGFNLLEEAGNNYERAEGLVETYTDSAKNILLGSKIPQVRKKMEYLIATNKEYRVAFLNYVCSFIQDIYFTGGSDVFASGKAGLDSLSTKTLQFIRGTDLSTERYACYNDYEVYVGY